MNEQNQSGFKRQARVTAGRDRVIGHAMMFLF